MFSHLLVPIDGTELSERAIAASLVLAGKLGAAITGFVAEPEMPLPAVGKHPVDYNRETDAHLKRTEDHAQSVLKNFEQRAQAAGVRFLGHYERTANVDEAIVRVAERQGCDMIVMATHGRGAFGELLFGSHTKSVLSRCKTPLLVLH